ncbi:hypothetical protein ACJVDH_10685 [Pedobacter sp. AW1-32]|uniref:hypothetical protein n=1 Tax=Pedobacter sp. AW1-32 TaxID=3383026 RepID=UPI003FF0E4B4
MLNLQSLFNQYNEILGKISTTKHKLEQETPTDLSVLDFVDAETADRFLVEQEVHQNMENELEQLNIECAEIEEELSTKLCSIGTKVLVDDLRDYKKVFIYCEEGTIICEECSNQPDTI